VTNGKEGRCTRDGGFVYAVNSGHTLHTPLFSAALTDSWAMPVTPDQVLTIRLGRATAQRDPGGLRAQRHQQHDRTAAGVGRRADA
jgi:hypothetical protein